MDFVCSYFSLYTEYFFFTVYKKFRGQFLIFFLDFSSFIFVLMPRIDLLCCGDQFFYLFFKISC